VFEQWLRLLIYGNRGNGAGAPGGLQNRAPGLQNQEEVRFPLPLPDQTGFEAMKRNLSQGITGIQVLNSIASMASQGAGDARHRSAGYTSVCEQSNNPPAADRVGTLRGHKMKQHVTIGVAGHVDHGKTSFVKQITGIDTDRHPEEKRRGLSLEAGIACWPRPDGTAVAFVDVPGHRDFLKNTVRGLQGVDFAVLLVAADDGVMPQTREHLDILTFFQVSDGIVVLSKIDCVDREILELAELEIMELTRSTFLEAKPVIRFSTRTGGGRDEVIAALDRALASGTRKKTAKGFRLWIDQVRGFPGVGTVVSGTVLSGTVKVNDEVQLLPAGILTRVRSLEEHGRKIESAEAGQRLGMNLHRLLPAEICRGMCLVQPETYPMTNRFNCELRSLHHAGEIIKDRQKVKLYLGTPVHNVLVRFIDSVPAEAGEHGLVQLQTKKPAPIAAGDTFVVSPLNRNTIIGGGRVLELAGEKIRAANKTRTALRLNGLLANDLDGYVGQLCQLHPGQPIDPKELLCRTLWEPEKIQGYIATAIGNNDLVFLADGRVVRTRELTSFTKMFVTIVTAAFERRPDRESMLVQEIMHQCNPSCHESLAYLVMENLCQEGRWVKEKGGIRPAGFEQRLPNDLAPVAEIVHSFAYNQRLRPFSAEYFVKSVDPHGFTLGHVRKMLDYFCKSGEMIRLKNDRYLTSGAMEKIKEKIRAWVDRKGEIHLRDCKEALDFNRGLGIHVLEYLDRAGFTIKKGEGRIVIANNFQHPVKMRKYK
jgi:selenocysteine-specific elongation factor